MKNNIINKKMKKRLSKVIIGMILFIILLLLKFSGFYNYLENSIGPRNSENIALIVSLLVYLLIGRDIIRKSINNLKNGQWMDEVFLMLIASMGAFILGDYNEGIAVVLFYEAGEFFQDYAVRKSKKSISDLMDVRPDTANIKEGDGYRRISPSEVKVGDVLIVLPGEKVPVDGVIVKGSSALDKKAMTGESMPFDVTVGDTMVSGCINLTDVIEMEASCCYKDSTVSKVLELMKSQGDKKAKAEEFISKLARYYTPIVIIAALVIGAGGALIFRSDASEWAYRALTFLVISCPCALVLSVPLSFFGGIGGTSNCGILIKGASYIEVLSKIETIIFDKTGTLTSGSFKVVKVDAVGDSKEVLCIAAAVESFSSHPIAVSIKNAVSEVELKDISGVKELSGLGISAIYKEKEILVGNRKLMTERNIEVPMGNDAYTAVYVAIEGKYAGTVFVADTIKENAKETIDNLKEMHISELIMLTGDRKAVAEVAAGDLGIKSYYSELLPGDKVSITADIIKNKEKGSMVAFVGDGINDAPVIAGVDCGISFGGIGSDAAVEAADVVIMNDNLNRIPLAIRLAKKTMLIVKENIIFALSIKVLILILAACGIGTMWLAVIADVGVCIIAVFNALRTIRFKTK